VVRAARQLVAVIPGWVWSLVAALSVALAALARSTFQLAGERRNDRLNSCEATVRALAAAVEAKDECTGGHLERVQRLGLLLATRIAPAEARSPEMAHAFLLHDVGKLAVPDAILTKPGRLTGAEMDVMRGHAEAGARILAGVPGLDRAVDVVRHHHERWDGGGYPFGLAGREIPLWARIFAVVDTLDAMTSERPYASRRSLDDALAEVEAHAGSQFDPACVRALLALDRAAIATTLGLPSPRTAGARETAALVPA
jgi:ribonuclease P protein subunit RPR2